MTASPTGTLRPTGDRRLEVLGADVTADWIRAGHETVVRVTVRNPGPARQFQVAVTHAGTPVTTGSISLTARGTATYEFGVVFTEPRRGPVTVAGVPAGTLTVAPDADPSPTAGVGTDADGGLGPTPGLFAAVLAVLLWRFRPDAGR